MLTLFHPFPQRVAGLLTREITGRSWTLETRVEAPDSFWLFDSANRQLLSAGYLLFGNPDQARLHDAEGLIHWEGRLPAGEWADSWDSSRDPGLEELIGGRLEEWRLIKVAAVTVENLIMVARPSGMVGDGPIEALPGQVSIRVSTVRSQAVGGLVSEGVLIEIDNTGEGDILARQLQSMLRDCGGINCPWPMMLLAQRAAAANGWIDSERMWNGRDRWSDVVRLLAQLLRGVRDESDPACVQEAMTLLNHLRILIDLGRKLQGKPAKAEHYRGLKELRNELASLRSLDILRQFLLRGPQSLSEHWVGVPGVIASCPDWTEPHAAALLGEAEMRRNAELERLRGTNRYISDPDTIIELSALWPPFPRIEANDSRVRSRWQANLDKRIRKLLQDISSLEEGNPDQAAWLDIRRRCRKIGRVMDACADWADHPELSFFRRMAGIWYKRLGELEAMQSNVRVLSDIASACDSPRAAEAATWLVRAMTAWLTTVNSQLHRTIPALALSARNARKKLA